MDESTGPAIEPLFEVLREGGLVPYLGPGMLQLATGDPVPADPHSLAAVITSRTAVPHKIRNRLTQAAQFIENFKHRKTLGSLMRAAFDPVPTPGLLHRTLAGLPLPLLVDTWYDDTMQSALRVARPAGDWGEIQGLSQAEHFGRWTGAFDARGEALASPEPAWRTILYRPLGGCRPAGNFLVSDSDFVEVLTEIDIQTPIPREVQEIRGGRHFLFLGCRFHDQLTRSFARQIIKRSKPPHWAVLPQEPTRMEARFLEENGIVRIAMTLSSFAELFCDREQLRGLHGDAPDELALERG